MAQPPGTVLNQQVIDQERLRSERAIREEAARKKRQTELDKHLSKYEDDPVSRTLATMRFRMDEEKAQAEAQKIARQKERDSIIKQYDDPVLQAQALVRNDIEKTKNVDAKRAFADREELEKIKERDQASRKLDRFGLGFAPLRETLGAAVNTVPTLAAPIARVGEAIGLIPEKAADELYRQSGDFGQAREQSREEDMSPWLSRMYGGAAQSLIQMGATPGGAGAKIIGSGVMSGSEALTTAEDAGLTGMDRLRYAATQGTLEAGVAWLGQKLFGAGIESRLAGQGAPATTWLGLAKNIVKDAAKEAPEEGVTSGLQDLSSLLEGVSPDLTFGDFVKNIGEAAAQAAMMAPMTNAPDAGRLLVDSTRRPVPPRQSPAPNQQPQAISIDEMIQRRDAAASSEPSQPVPPILPEVEAFTQNPSRTKYEAAVKAGLPPIEEAKTAQGRAKYAAELNAAKPQEAPAEPATVRDSQTVPPTINPVDVPDIDSVINLLKQKGEPDETRIQNAESPADAERQGQGRKEGLLNEPGISLPEATPVATGGSSPDQSSKEAGPVSKPEPAETVTQEATEPRRGIVGDRLATGEVVQTSSGRSTTPFPKIDVTSDRKAGNTVKRVDEWLHSNALAEAEARGDEWNADMFRNEKPGKMPPATKALMEEYLFGEQPKVVPSIFKTLVPEPTSQQLQPTPGFAALPQKSQDLFNKAFESKDTEALKQMVAKNNVAWNTEFQNRTGIKLPKTVKGRNQVVLDWATTSPTTEPPAGQMTKDKHAQLPMWDVYPTQINGKVKFAVKQSEKGGFGDGLFDSESDAQNYAKIARQQSDESLARIAKAKAAEEAATKKQQEHEASFQGFLTDDPMVKGRRLKTLDTLVNYEKKPITRKALVENRVADGWTVNADGQLQAPTGEFLDEGAITKTGIDYARHLVNLKPAEQKALEPVEAPAEQPPTVEYPEKGPVIEDWFGPDKARVLEWTKTVTPGKLKRKDYAAVYRDGKRIAAGLVEMASGNMIDILSDGKIQRFFQGDKGNKFAVGIARQRTPEKPAEPTPKAEAETDIEAAMSAELDRLEAAEEAAKQPAKPEATPKAAKFKLSPDDLAQLKADVASNNIGFMQSLNRDKITRARERLQEKGNTAKEIANLESNIQRFEAMLTALEKMAAPPKPPRTKTGEKLGELSEKTGEARKKAADDFLKKMKGLGLNTGLGSVNAEAVTAAATMVRAYIADGTVKFADFVMKFAEDTSPALARKFSDYLEAAWKISGKRNPDLDPAGKVADVLGPEKEVTNEDVGTTETGAPDAPGREEDQGTGTGDRSDSQDATGPADAEVLAGPPAKNGRKAKKTRNSSSVRGGSGGKVRSGSGEADSGGVDASGGRSPDSGGTTSDDTGEGRDRAPQSTRPNYHLTNPEAIIGGGPKAKFERNRKAIEIVRDVEESNRAPTAEELDTLAGYMGWGAFGQELFNGTWERPRPKEGWEDQDEWLRTYLGEEDWKSAQQSIVNAHFTDPQTVTATWDMLRRMGFTGGRVLEPSMGIGNFFSLMPRDLMERSTLTGIELDKMTAKIAKLLHPQINIQQKGYQESQTPDNFYDVIVSNVPFGNYPIPDRRYKQDFSIHNYFFKRAFDQVKPGGVIAFLTSNTTMDGKVQAKLMRAQIAKDGDLVTAIRFPSGAFQAYAGTKVVADLIVIRKRKEGDTPQGDQNWIDVSEVDTPAGNPITVNNYWQANPQNILGTMTWGHGTTSGRPGMIVNQPTDLQASLDAAVQSMPENIINTERSSTQGRERPNTTAMRQNSVLAQDNDLWIVKGEQLVPLVEFTAWYRKGSKQATIDKNRKEVESLLEVREAMRQVLDQQAASEDATDARADLNRTYDKFVKEHGPIGKSAAAQRLRKVGDPMGNTLLALESVTGTIFKKYTKRPIFERSTVRQKKTIDAPTVNDAFAIERNRSLDLDMQRIADSAQVPVADVIQQLESGGRIYKTGNGTYDAADVFLSGNMSRKLRQLQAAQAEGVEGLDRSIEAVKERIPTPVPYSQIDAKLGSVWVESSDFADFYGHLLNEPSSMIAVERRISGWKITIPGNINSKAEATVAHGHPGIEFSKLVTAAMNNATVKLTMPDPDGGDFRVTDPVATKQANDKINELREKFTNWIWTSPERIERLSGVYNEEFNSTVTPTFDDVPLQFEGMALERGEQPFNLRKHQESAVWRGIVTGKGIYAHEVGTGKSLTMGALAMESRRLGIASKPILLAHNANSLAVRNEIQEAYPSANILYVDNLDAKNKAATLQSIATENWDLIVVPHSMAETFQLRPETVEALLKPEMDALEAAAQEAFDESESTDFAKGSMPTDLDTMDEEDLRALKEPTAKELVKERMKLRARIVKAQQSMSDGTGVFFEDMGVDMVMVDEAHVFKKLPITTKQKIKGLNKQASGAGNMLMLMTDYIRSKNNGRGVHLFTGTPITNTINEIFNMMRFVMAEEMESSHVRGWDGWFNNFATSETLTELSSGGTWENFDRLSSFVNLPELRQMVGQYMDIVFADDMPEFVPRESREGRSENPVGRPFKQVHNVIINMIDAQRDLSTRLAERYITFRDATGRNKVRMMREPGGQFNPLVIEGEGVKLAMDPRLNGYGTKQEGNAIVTDTDLIDPKDPNLKINKMIQNAMTHYHEHPKSAQMVFMQIGYTDSVQRTMGRDAAGKPIKQTFRVFNLAKEIKRRLMEEGVQENEIAIFSDLSKERRAEAAQAMRRGEIRFAIGSTDTMGTGVNAQDELIAMHHLDAPWMPGELEQRNGRGHRQGNRWNTVHEYRYLTEGPQDGRRWQVLLTKDRFIKEFMRGDAAARVIEMDEVDMSEDGTGTDMEQTFSAAAGDPRIMQRIRLEGQVERLRRMRDSHAQTITDTASKANSKLRWIQEDKKRVDTLDEMHSTWAANRTETPEITLRDKKYTGNQAITDALQELGDRYHNTIHPRTAIGEYRGLPLFIDNGVLYVGDNQLVTAKWNLASLQAIMANMPERINKLKDSISKDQRFIEMANKAVGEPFPKQKQLDSKQRQLQRLIDEMTINPTVAPAWLRLGAPIGTTFYFEGNKYEVAGHRMDHTMPFVLYSDGEGFLGVRASAVTDAEGTPLFPDLEKLPEATPDPATPAADAAPASELRKAADAAQQRVREQKILNAQYDGIIVKEWNRFFTRLDAIPSGIPLSDEMYKAIAGRVIGTIKLGVKQFDAFIKDLRANLDEAVITSIKPNLISTWNALRAKYDLDEATGTGFDLAMSNTVDVDLEQAVEAAKAADPALANAYPESANADDKLYSTQNAFSAAARTELDMPERPPVPEQKREPSIEAAKTYGETKAGSKFIDDLIAELVNRPRAVTPWENDLLNYRHVELDTDFEKSLRSKIAAAQSGDDAQEAVSDQKSRNLKQQLQTLIESVLEPIGTAAGRALQARKAIIDRSYTVVRLALEFEAAHGRAPNTEELAAITKQVDDLNAKIAELEKMLAESDANNNDLQAKLKEAHDTLVNTPTEQATPEPKETKAPPVEKEASPRRNAAREKIDNAYKRLTSMLQEGTAFSVGGALGESGSVFIDLATGYSELGVITLKEFLSRVGKRMGPAAKALVPQLTSAWRQVRGSADQADISSVTDKIDSMDPDTIGRAARNLHAFVIERDALDASPEGREAAVAAVHSILVDFVPGLTIDDTARAMSGIGIYSELSENEIEVIRRDQKAQLLLLEQIGDWKKGTPPPATGQERPPVSDEQRALRKMVNDAKKASGLSTTTAGQLRSALDAAKRMATNRIADLTKAIESGTRISKNQKLLQPDAELTALQESRDALQKLYDETFGKPELSDEQRLNMAEKALDRAISDLEADLKVGKLYPDAPKPRMTSPAIEAKRAVLDALKANREEMRLQSGEAQQRSDAAYERHLLERSAELAQRLAAGDFSKKPKKPDRVLTPAMTKLMLSIAQDKQAIEKLRKKWEFSQRHIIVRAFLKGPVAGAHMIRKALTTLDQSLIGRQGWLLGITHPLIYAKSARKAFASKPLKAMSLFPTEQDLFDTQAALDADPRWVQLEKIAKLAVTDVHGGLNREEGNMHVPDWFDKLPGIGASERAGSAFINTQRRLVFRHLATQLATQQDGTERSLSNAELRVIGNLVNISSGRGSLGKWANSLEALTLVFFSPRWWASRLAFWTLQPLWHDARWVGGEGASKEVRMMAAKEWTKQAGAQIAIMGIAVAALTAAFGDPGDDEEWDWYGDPRSPNFGRIRIGSSMIDMTAGLGQHLSLYSRLFSGTQVDRWEGAHDTQKLSLFGRHLRGKLAPIPSTFVDYLAGESMNRDKFNSMEWWLGKGAPLALQDAYKTIKEEGLPAGPLLATWMVLGGGVQTYEGRTEARADVANELRALKKQGKTEKAQELLNKHLENAASDEATEAIRTAEPEEQAGLQKVIDGTESPELTAAIEKEKQDIILNASGRVSTDKRRISNDEKLEFSGSDDKGRTTARSLVPMMVPDVDEAIRLYNAAYRARNGSLLEKNGQVKSSVWAGRARIRQLYQK